MAENYKVNFRTKLNEFKRKHNKLVDNGIVEIVNNAIEHGEIQAGGGKQHAYVLRNQSTTISSISGEVLFFTNNNFDNLVNKTLTIDDLENIKSSLIDEYENTSMCIFTGFFNPSSSGIKNTERIITYGNLASKGSSNMFTIYYEELTFTIVDGNIQIARETSNSSVMKSSLTSYGMLIKLY